MKTQKLVLYGINVHELPIRVDDSVATPNYTRLNTGRHLENKMLGCVLHHTAGFNSRVTLTSTRGENRVSCHDIILQDGTIQHLSKGERWVTWHAGGSIWPSIGVKTPQQNLNRFTYGIEFETPHPGQGPQVLTEQQVRTFAIWGKALADAFGWTANRFRTHQMVDSISPTSHGKIDILPSEWKRVMSAAIQRGLVNDLPDNINPFKMP